MNLWHDIIIVASLTAMGGAGTYLIWPSRLNIGAHLSLAFAVTAYLVPGFILRTPDSFPSYVTRMYTHMIALGAGCYLLGLFLGSKIKLEQFYRPGFNRLPVDKLLANNLWRKIGLLMAFGIAGMVVCFYFMGYIPMFAANPMAAKYARGAYVIHHKPLMWAYRACNMVVLATIPLALAVWYVKKRWTFLVLGGLGVVMIALTLSRGPVAFGILTFLGLLAARKRSHFLAYMLLVLLLFPLGSAANYVLGDLLGSQRMTANYGSATLSNLIGGGAPDISDQETFLSVFDHFGKFTHGRTFAQALIPGDSPYKPNIYPLIVLHGGQYEADPNDIVQGGIRLTMAIWGYTAFGWRGVVVVPLLDGLIFGIGTALTKRRVDNKNLLRSTLALGLYGALWGQLARFYSIQLASSLPTILLLLLIIYWGKSRKPKVSSGQVPKAASLAGHGGRREALPMRT